MNDHQHQITDDCDVCACGEIICADCGHVLDYVEDNYRHRDGSVCFLHRGEPAITDADLYNQMLDDADLHELKHAATAAVVDELVAGITRHSNMLAELVDLLNTVERRVAVLEGRSR